MADFTNLNLCFSVTDTITTTLRQLSSFKCTEVIVQNLGASPLKVWDVGSTMTPTQSAAFCYIVAPSADFTFRGLTNSNEVSAAFISGSGLVSYRTQFFSSFPLTVY
jgi:hypothetical protein